MFDTDTKAATGLTAATATAQSFGVRGVDTPIFLVE